MTKTIQKIKNNFNNIEYYDLAFTHKSWVNENDSPKGTNERLEFLGDAILEYIVSSFIYNKLRDKEEGFLTALRANIVNTKNLATLAKKLDLGSELKLSRGEENGGGRSNPALLADTVEALIGAIYIDQGIDAASEFVLNNLLNDIDTKLEMPLKDPKSRLQELVQAKGKMAPKYQVAKEAGPDHEKTFIVDVKVDGQVVATGEGASKLKAEQAAAERALAKFAQKK